MGNKHSVIRRFVDSGTRYPSIFVPRRVRGRKAALTVDVEDFWALAQRCRDLLRVATRSEVKEQLRQWIDDFEDEAEAMEGRRSRYVSEVEAAEG